MPSKIGYMRHSYDWIGLSTETKPGTDVDNGSTFLEVDTSKVFIYYNGTWYEL